MAAAGALLRLTPSASLGRRPATGNKLVRRLVTSLEAVAYDPAAADRALRKIISSRPGSDALQLTLTHLISSSPSLAVSMYRRMSSEPWFRWNPHVAASVAAILANSSRDAESDSFIADCSSGLSPRDADIFRCALIESYAAQGLGSAALEIQEALMAGPSSPSVKRKACEAAVKGLCAAGLPADAEVFVREMEVRDLRPSGFLFTVLAQAYGKNGLIGEMRRILVWMEKAGWELDTACCSVVISCYADCGLITEVLRWVRRMRTSEIQMSVRTYNAALYSCHGFFAMLKDTQRIPVSIGEAVRRLVEGGFEEEGVLVEELSVGNDLLGEVCKWGDLIWELDLHGCQLGSAFVVLFMWLEELKRRFGEGKEEVKEVAVVCGCGKNSRVRGESPLRMLLAKIIFKLESPLKKDRKNTGQFIANGKAVKKWLLSL